MKYFLKIILALSLAGFFLQSAHAENKIEPLYQGFLQKIEKKYSTQQQDERLSILQVRLEELQDSNMHIIFKKRFEALDTYNNEEIFSRFLKKEFSLEERKLHEKEIKKISDTGKIPYSKVMETFKGYLKYNWKIQEVSGWYYGYNFTDFTYFEDEYGVSKSSLKSNGLSADINYVYADESNAVFFLKDFQRSKLLSQDTLWGIANKKEVLVSLADDAKYPSSDFSETWGDISQVVRTLTKGKNKQEKIEAIYAWILENISYSTKISLQNKKIFSAIEIFKNKQGVCTAYAKLFLYMLSLAGIHDVEVIKGHVIDAQDFPQIGHAWLRIGGKYYDPTFDDPLGATQTKTQENYRYFGLPRDIFYANRFDYGDLPEAFKTYSDTQIQQYIHNYLVKLLPKYKDRYKSYNVFAPVTFRLEHNITATTIITPELLSQKIPFYQADGESLTFQKNEKKQHISFIKYFVIDSENTQNVLSQLAYNTDSLTLFDWKLPDGTRQWRLAYELTLR